MVDFVNVLVADAKATVAEGYYENLTESKPAESSLKAAILRRKAAPVIAEIKGASPSVGVIKEMFDPSEVARAMARGGAVGVSVLTEPKHFNGSLSNITAVRRSVSLPILMKDIVVDPGQVDAASRVGASAVLLIQTLFDKGLCTLSLGEMIAKTHSKNLEVLLETHNQDEFARAVKTDADLVGINNRNLGTLQVDLNTTKNILANCASCGKVVVIESGIRTQEDLRFLRRCGARAFLIGSSIMLSEDIEAKMREFVNA